MMKSVPDTIPHKKTSRLDWEILQKRGENYLAHVNAGQPSILVFAFDILIDREKLEKPVNYFMIRIIDRRQQAPAPIQDDSEHTSGELVLQLHPLHLQRYMVSDSNDLLDNE